MSYWAVAQTESQREIVAEDWLRRGGFAVYLPRIRARARPQPLFPGYIFVLVESAWYPIRWTIGVHHVLLAGDEPARLQDRVIGSIRSQEDHRGFVKLPPKGPYRGQRARVMRGSFLGEIGVYEGQTGRERARILLELLGRSVPVELPAGDLQFAS